MNVAQFLQSQLGNISGSGGKVKGKEIKESNILLKQVNINGKKNKGEDFKRTLFVLLSEFLSNQINEFQDVILSNLKNFRLSDSGIQIVSKIIKSMGNHAQISSSRVSKLIQTIDLILSISTDTKVKKTLLENLEIVHDFLKKTEDDKDQRILLEKISDILKDSNEKEISQKDIKEILQRILENLNHDHLSLKRFKDTDASSKASVLTSNDREIPSSTDLKKFQDPSKSLSKNNQNNSKQAPTVIQPKSYTDAIEDSSNNKKNILVKEKNISNNQDPGQMLNTVTTTSNGTISSFNPNNKKASSQVTTNKTFTNTLTNKITNLNNADTLSSKIDDLSKKIDAISEIRKMSSKDVNFPHKFSFKIISFERINQSKIGQEKILENFFHKSKIDMSITKSTDTSKINKKFQTNIAQKRYEPLRFDSNKDFNDLLKKNIKASQERILSGNIPNEKTSESLNKKSFTGDNDMSNQPGNESLKLKLPFEYNGKVLETNRNFSKEVTNIIEQMIQKGSDSIGTPKNHIEIQRVIVKLHPPELGDMEITLVKNGKNIELNMNVISETAKDTVEKNLNHLDQRLKEIGFNLEKFNLEIRNQDLKNTETHSENGQHNGKNYQEPQEQNQRNQNKNTFDGEQNNSFKFFDEIFEREVMINDEQRV